MQPFLPGILRRGVAELRRSLERGKGAALEPELVERLDRVLGKDSDRAILVRLECVECGQRIEGRATQRAQGRSSATTITKVLPRVPVRHWVLSLPRRLRVLAGHDDGLGTRYARAFVRTIFEWQRRVARDSLQLEAEVGSGAVTVVQRGGSALNLDVHVHAIVLDGVYVGGAGEEPVFHRLPDPGRRDLGWVTARARGRIEHLVRDHGDRSEKCSPGVLRELQEASARHRVARGERAGSAVKRGHGRSNAAAAASSGRTHARAGFSVHAASALRRDDRRAIANLAGYLTRPPLQAASIRLRDDGTLGYRLKNPQRDGATSVELTAEELAEKLIAMLPSGPGRRLAYHGVLAPAAAARRRIVPGQLELFPLERPRTRRPRVVPRRYAKPSVDDPSCPQCGGTLRIAEVEESGDWLLRA